MFDTILQWDRDLFLALNFDGGRFLDEFFWIVTGKLTWVPLYLLIIFLLWRRYGWKYTLLAVVFIALAVVFVDHVANFFKNNVPKFRPTHTPELEGLVHQVHGYRGFRYGTVSAHAATTCVVMTFASTLIRRKWFTVMMIAWVVLVCYSRIYVAAHFPLDIIFGAIIGIITAVLMVRLFRWTENKIEERCSRKRQNR